MEQPSLDEILKQYGLCKCGRHRDSSNFAYHICIEQGLRYKISSLIDQVIGADDRLQTQQPSIELEVERNRAVVVRNRLRAEQRKRKEELLG